MDEWPGLKFLVHYLGQARLGTNRHSQPEWYHFLNSFPIVRYHPFGHSRMPGPDGSL